MLALFFPFAGIALGGLIGVFLKKWINRYCDALMKVVGFCVVYLGLDMAFGSDDFLGIMLCMFLGTLIGEVLRLEGSANSLGDRVEKLLGGGQDKGGFSKAFVTTSVLFILGPLPLLGPIEAATGQGWTSLLSQTAMDSASSVIFGAAMGIGVSFSAVSIFVYELIVFLCAGFIQPLLLPEVLTMLYAVGGIIIAAAGAGMVAPQLNLKITNMIPAMFLAIPYAFIIMLI